MARRIVLLFPIIFVLLQGTGSAAEPAPLRFDFAPFLGAVASYADDTPTPGAAGGFYLKTARGDLSGELYFRAAYDDSPEKIDSDRSRFWYELEADGSDAWAELSPPRGWRRSLACWTLGAHAIRNSTYVDESFNVNLGPSWRIEKDRARISLSLGASYYDFLLDDEPARDNGYRRERNDFEVHGGYLRMSASLAGASGSRILALAQTIVDEHGNLFESRLRALYDLPLSGGATLRSGIEGRFFDLGSRTEILDFDSEALARVEILFRW